MKKTSEVHDILASNRAHKRANIAQLDTIESKMFYGGTHRESARKTTNPNEVYDGRIQELANTLANVFAAIKNDELLSTMMDDPTSKKFAEHRIREIIEECITNDRENLLKDLYNQNATLETENNDLEQEYAKVFNEQKEVIFDFNNRIHEMQKEKKGLEEHIGKLNTELDEIKEDYEQKLQQKDAELFRSTESELNELQTITNKVKELEAKLKESDKNYFELSRDYALLQGELNIQQNLNKENQSREEKLLRDENVKLYDENRQLKHSLMLYEEGKKAFEDGFKKNVEEIEKGIKVERETYKQNLEKIQKRYEDKIKQYKEKIKEYKAKLGEKQKELEDVISKSDQEHTMYEREIELLESRLEEERSVHQHKLIRIEEEEYQRLNESSLQYESQISKLKVQFEDMLNEKVQQIQQEARSLQSTPRGDTARFMNTDYVKLAHHEEMIDEKTNLIKKLNKELVDKDYSFNIEITNKLKDLEKRLTEEFELKQTISKRTIVEFENQLAETKAQKRRVEANLANLEGENNVLKQDIDAIATQKKNLLEAVEEWCSKAKRLNISYEEERSRTIEMEDRIAEFQEKYDKLKSIVQSLGEEMTEKDLEIRRLNEQLTILEGELLEKERHFMASDMAAKNLEHDYVKTREELETTRKFEAQIKVKASEGETKMRQLLLEIEDSHRLNTKLKSQVESLNNRIDDLNLKHSKTEANWVHATKERDIAQRNLEKALFKINKISQNKQQIAKVLTNKFEKLKTSFKETENIYRVNINRLIKENEKKIIELAKFCAATIEKNASRHAAEKESLAKYAQRDLDYHCEVLKERNNKLQRDMSELYEQKFSEKDRTIQNLQDMNRKFNEKLRLSEESLEKLEGKYNRLIEEKEYILKEKEQVDANFELQRQRYLKEIDRFNEEMKKSSQEFARQKAIIEEDFYNHAKSLLLEVDVLKRRHHETLSKYANQVQEISESHREEAERIEVKYKDEIQGFEDILAESNMVEQELAKRALILTEKADKLERQNKHLETQVRTLEEKEDDYLSQYEMKMEELRDVFEKENARMSTFKSEKFNEISKQKSAIQILEKEIILKDKKIETLTQEKEVIKQHLQDSLSQNPQPENPLLRNKQNSAHVSLFQNKDTKKLDFGMVDSLSNAFSSPKIRTTRRYEKENVSQNENESRSVRK